MVHSEIFHVHVFISDFREILHFGSGTCRVASPSRPLEERDGLASAVAASLFQIKLSGPQPDVVHVFVERLLVRPRRPLTVQFGSGTCRVARSFRSAPQSIVAAFGA